PLQAADIIHTRRATKPLRNSMRFSDRFDCPKIRMISSFSDAGYPPGKPNYPWLSARKRISPCDLACKGALSGKSPECPGRRRHSPRSLRSDRNLPQDQEQKRRQKRRGWNSDDPSRPDGQHMQPADQFTATALFGGDAVFAWDGHAGLFQASLGVPFAEKTHT